MRPAPVQLTAWTVSTEPSGTVAVTIRDLRDPAGLQRALLAHGVPAIVRFYPPGSPMPGCVISVPSRLAAIEGRVFAQPPAASHGPYLLFIDPAAVPRTDKIAIDAVRGNGFSIGLVTQDGRCPPGSRPGGAGMKSSRSGHPSLRRVRKDLDAAPPLCIGGAQRRLEGSPAGSPTKGDQACAR